MVEAREVEGKDAIVPTKVISQEPWVREKLGKPPERLLAAGYSLAPQNRQRRYFRNVAFP
jgi:hypothetical protein